ncbi:MAG: PTS glucose transporter subunit IIA [Bowdeniella nasicola]|nr:PTS glucose transporter subunit IIA [Bowdeniella nasicola]
MTQVLAPFAGKVVGLDTVPDEVFASGMLGAGVALWPRGKIVEVCAPISGKILSWHPHACVIVSDEGFGILTHLGLDTVQARGRGFTWSVAKGDYVTAGDLLAQWDTHETQDFLPLTPVVVMDVEHITRASNTDVTAGDHLYTIAGN